MPNDPLRTDVDSDNEGSETVLEQRRLAQEMAAEMSRAYGSSLERDAGTEFRSPRLQKAAYHPA
jgi:hypothetical protein